MNYSIHPSKADHDSIRQAILAGESDRQIAARTGLSHQRVCQLRHKWLLPTAHAMLTQRVVEAMRARGFRHGCQSQVAAELGVNRCTVVKIYRRLGLTHEAAARREERMQYIHDLANAGAATSLIARLTGLSIGIVQHRRPHESRSQIRARTKERHEQIRVLVAQGHAQHEVAERLKVSQALVSRVMLNVSAGTPLSMRQPPRFHRSPLKDQVADRVAQGQPASEIALALGVSVQTIHYWRRVLRAAE